jgi:PAS domain S-box-containing protein
MINLLRVLIVDDSDNDAQLIMRYLRAGGYDPIWKRVDTLEAMESALDQKQWDVILCDYKMPLFTTSEALELIQDRGIDIPFIIVSGAIGEDTAVAAMKSGAHDYLMKDNLSRLVVAIEREIREAKIRRKKKKAEEDLNESEENFRHSLDDSPLGIRIVTAEGKTLYANREILNIYGCDSIEELATISHKESYTPESYAQYEIRKEKRLRGEHVPSIYEVSIVRKDGKIRHLDVFRKQVLWNGEIQFQTIYNDITERKLAEDELRISEERYRMAEAIGHVGNWEYNLQTTKFWGSDETKRIYGFDPEALDFTIDEVENCIPERERVHQALIDLIEADKPYNLEFEIHPKNSLTSRIISSVAELKRDEHGNPLLVTGGIQDITKRKQDESARVASLKGLLESQERYKALFDHSLNLIYIMDFDGQFIDANSAALNMFGYKREEIRSVNMNSIMHEDQLPLALEIIREITETGIQKDPREIRLRNKGGREIYLETQGSIVMSKGKPAAIQMIARDITERKQMEEELRQSEEKYRTILENMQDAYFEVDLAGSFTFCNDAMCRDFGYSREELMGMNYRQYTDHDNAKKLFQAYQKIYTSGEPIKEHVGLIIRKDGSKRYIEGSVSLKKDSQGKPIGFKGIDRDITDRKQTEDKLLLTLESLRKAVGVTIHVLVSALEARDPYTAGHQSRVADLACAIATEMGLSQDQIEGIRLAGSIHDIGKLSVPAEILSKPTKLTNLEFLLIKEHSQTGYEMLKDVESPWPLAQIVYQHHERMDGSGYPRNLKGDEIIIEARIMAVADVVEAMASNRPYRPGLGIDAALAEIEKNKGIFYDSTVGDACLRLFREKGYQLT